MTELAKEYRDNLAKLRDFLLSNNVAFEMDDFITSPDGEDDLTLDQYRTGTHACGTAACAVGWAPFVIAPDDSHFKLDGTLSYWTYVKDKLIPTAGRYNPEFDWAFGSDWSGFDNTREGAAYRIDFLVRNGRAPKNYYVDRSKASKGYITARDKWLKNRNIPIPKY